MTISLENILKGKTQIEGIPAFHLPLLKLIQKGHEVDFVLLSNFKGPYNIKVNWLKKENIIYNIYMPYSEKKGMLRIHRKVYRFFKLLFCSMKATKGNRYDLIYDHIGVVGQIVAALRGIPTGVRWYGDSNFCYATISKYGKFIAAFKHPLSYISFQLPYDFFLITDDHSYGDKVYEAWAPKNKSNLLYFWKSGIEMKEIDQCQYEIEVPNVDYIFYAARFSRWKRQDRAIEVLKEMHLRGRKIHLYFAGHLKGGPSSLSYIEELKAKIKEYELNDYVHFLGGISQDSLKIIANYSKATLLMYDIANLCNIFYEVLSIGAVVITIDTGSLDEFIYNGKNGFLVKNEKEACNCLELILDNPDLEKRIKENAKKTAYEKVMTADERFEKEVALIESVINSYPNRSI